MGRYVTFSSQSTDRVADGVFRSPITTGDVKEFCAEHLRLTQDAALDIAVPRGSDGYLFVLSGEVRIVSADTSLSCAAQSFAALREGLEVSISNRAGKEAQLIYVRTLADGSGGKLAGLNEDIVVRTRANAPTKYIEDQKKNRIYFVSGESSRSARAHAMIVEYEEGTRTPMHHHPNAESIFILLGGDIRFSINGDDVILSPGQAAYFGANDVHALQCADGTRKASFLEFHIPASFTTVRQ